MQREWFFFTLTTLLGIQMLGTLQFATWMKFEYFSAQLNLNQSTGFFYKISGCFGINISCIKLYVHPIILCRRTCTVPLKSKWFNSSLCVHRNIWFDWMPLYTVKFIVKRGLWAMDFFTTDTTLFKCSYTILVWNYSPLTFHWDVITINFI